jgi:hypothetical protein
MTRIATNKLFDMIDSGLLDKGTVIDACLKYMSESDVEDMCQANEFFIKGEDEDAGSDD